MIEYHDHFCPDRLRPLLKGYGLGRAKIRMLIHKLGVLMKNMGQRGTLIYLKALSRRFNHWYSKGDIAIRQGDPWVNFRWWKRLVKKRGQLVKMANAIHRVITFKGLQPEQWDKFRSAVDRDEPEKSALVDALRYVRLGAKRIGKRVGPVTGSPCFQRYMEKYLRKTGGSRYGARRRAYHALLRDMAWALEQGLFQFPLMLDALSPFLPSHIRELAADSNQSDPWDVDSSVGSLHANQEPGGKARFFASPRLLVQSALEGLFRELDRILYDIPEDCCHDQWSAIPDIESRLASGQTVWSTDISSATDTTPLELQTVALRELGVPEHAIELFKFVSRGEWSTSKEIQRKTGLHSIEWKVGQPLGLKPSFAVFSVTMHCLLKGICYSLGMRNNHPHTDPYYQLGDDHVGFDEDVEREFIRVLTSLGIQVSSDKSVVSSYVAEFGGALVRRDGFTFRPGKWRSLDQSTGITYAADPNFDPYAVWPKTVANLVMKLRERQWPYGFQRVPLSELPDADLYTAVALVTKGFSRERAYHTTFDLSHDLKTFTFGHFLDEKGGECFTRRGRRLSGDNPYALENKRWEFHHAQSEKSFWDELARCTATYNPVVHYATRLDWIDFKCQAYIDLIASALTMPFEQSMLHPFLRDVALRRRCTDNYSLSSALIESAPFRYLGSYARSSERGFYSLLRRVAECKDVIPTRLCPDPIRS